MAYSNEIRTLNSEIKTLNSENLKSLIINYAI